MANLCIHSDLRLVEKLVYQRSGLTLQNLTAEDESADYGASEFLLNDQSIKFRVAKITPTKIGQFVTFWKRIDGGPIMPYDINDTFDYIVVSVRAENHYGQFVFPKAVLCATGIVSCQGKEGKRAIRVYPPWDKAENAQAKKTQAWQLQYFIEFFEEGVDVTRFRHLFSVA